MFRSRKSIIIVVILFLSLPLLVFSSAAKSLVLRFTDAVSARAAWRESKSLELAANRRAADESAAFIMSDMAMAGVYADKLQLLDKALSQVDRALGGIYCEFGVYTGGTINHIASRVAGPIHGFDSFEGLPEDWRAGFGAGTFKVGGLPEVRPNVKLYKGWFKDTLPKFKQDNPGPLAFGHLDADLYSSTKDVFEALGDRIVTGTVLQFDEFFNYPGWQNGEFKAFAEFCQARRAEVEYIGYVSADEQVAVRIKKIASPALPAP